MNDKVVWYRDKKTMKLTKTKIAGMKWDNKGFFVMSDGKPVDFRYNCEICNKPYLVDLSILNADDGYCTPGCRKVGNRMGCPETTIHIGTQIRKRVAWRLMDIAEEIGLDLQGVITDCLNHIARIYEAQDLACEFDEETTNVGEARVFDKITIPLEINRLQLQELKKEAMREKMSLNNYIRWLIGHGAFYLGNKNRIKIMEEPINEELD